MDPFFKLLPALVKASISSLNNPIVAIVVIALAAFSVIAWVSHGPR